MHPQFTDSFRPSQVPFDPRNPFFIITHICEGLMTFNRFTEAFEILETICKLPLAKVELAKEHLSDLNLLQIKSKYLIKKFKEVWEGLAEGLAISKSLPQLIRFNQFVGNFLLDQNIEVELEQMIRENKEFGKSMKKRVGVDLTQTHLMQFDVLMDCLEIRLRLKKLATDFAEGLNDLNEFSMEIREEEEEEKEQSWEREKENKKGGCLHSPFQVMKRESCIPNFQNTRMSIFAERGNPLKRQFTSIKPLEDENQSFELGNQLNMTNMGDSFLQKLKSKQEEIEKSNSSQVKVEVVFQTSKLEYITEQLLQLGSLFFKCTASLQHCRNLELVSELGKILWEAWELMSKIPRFTSKIRANLTLATWRLWTVVENFERSCYNLLGRADSQGSAIVLNKVRLVELLAELVEEKFCDQFWVKEDQGEPGKEKIYIRNVDIEVILKHSCEGKLKGKKIRSHLRKMINSHSLLQEQVKATNLKIGFWNHDLQVIWNKGNLYDEDQEDMLDGFFREDFLGLLNSENKEENGQHLGKRMLENQNMEKSEGRISKGELLKNQELLSELTFSQVLSLPGGVWHKMKIKNDRERIKVMGKIEQYIADLMLTSLPQLLDESSRFFFLKENLMKNHIQILMLYKKLLFKSKARTSPGGDSNLFISLSRFQSHLVKHEMFKVFSKVISENNKPLGLLKLLENVKNPEIKKCLLNNFKFLEIFSPEEFHSQNKDFGTCLENYTAEFSDKVELLKAVINGKARVNIQIGDLFSLANSEGNEDKEKEGNFPFIDEDGLMVVLQFDKNKKSLWLGLMDLATSKCLVKELKNEGATYLGLKKIQLELEHSKYLLKQNIFHSTAEFEATWSQSQKALERLQSGAQNLLNRVEVIIAAFLKSLEIIKLRTLGIVSTSRGYLIRRQESPTGNESKKTKPPLEGKSVSKEMTEEQFRSMASHTIKVSKSEATEDDKLVKFDIKRFRERLRKNLFLFGDLELLDIDLHKLDALSRFQVVYRDLSVETFFRRFTKEEARKTSEQFQRVNLGLAQLKTQLGKNSSLLQKEKGATEEPDKITLIQKKILEIFRSEGLTDSAITAKSSFFLAFNGKPQQNNLDYIKAQKLEEQLSEGTISVNLGENLGRHFEGLDSAKEVIEIHDLKKALSTQGLLTLHSVEPCLSIIPWETLFNFFLSDKFTEAQKESSPELQAKGITDHPLILHSYSKDSSQTRRCPIMFISDRIPFARKSFFKYPAFEKKFLLFNNMNYSRETLLLFSFLGAPLIILGKTNLPLMYHTKLLNDILSGMNKSFESFQKIISQSKTFLDHFFCFGISLKPIIKI